MVSQVSYNLVGIVAFATFFFQIDDGGIVRHFDLTEGEGGLFCVRGGELMDLETLLEPYDLGTRLYPDE